MSHLDPLVRKEYQRQYRKAHRLERRLARPDHDRARHANQRARLYSCEGVLTIHDIRAVMAAGKCFYCGATERLTVDHLIPLDQKGPNTRENLVCCCFGCNSSKHRSDRPGKWSRFGDCCRDCGTSERKHSAKG